MAIIKSVDENYKDIYKSITPEMEEAINLSKATFSSQRDTVNKNYGSLISDTNTEYYDEENRAAIQKIVNEQKIAQKMENLGLTDSGLNRTQQTAVQLSYSNNQAKLERQRQKAVDALNLEMQGKLSEIDINESNTVAGIKDKYSQAALSAAQEKYNTEVNALADVEKERLKASNDGSDGSKTSNLILKHLGQEKTDDNGNIIKYYEGSDGETYYAKEGYNPYNDANNVVAGNKTKNWHQVEGNKNLSDSQKAVAVYGTTSNGYQPKGVVYNGTNFGPLNGSVDRLPDGNEITGKSQNVWKTDLYGQGIHFWVWYGLENTYVEVEQQDGKWVVI